MLSDRESESHGQGSGEVSGDFDNLKSTTVGLKWAAKTLAGHLDVQNIYQIGISLGGEEPDCRVLDRESMQFNCL